jgi:hypothetical protein
MVWSSVPLGGTVTLIVFFQPRKRRTPDKQSIGVLADRRPSAKTTSEICGFSKVQLLK